MKGITKMKPPHSFQVEVVITPLWDSPADTLEEATVRMNYRDAFSVEEKRFRTLITDVMNLLTEKPYNG